MGKSADETRTLLSPTIGLLLEMASGLLSLRSMKIIHILSLVGVSLIVAAWPVMGNDKGRNARNEEAPAQTAPVPNIHSPQTGKESWKSAKVAISEDERRVIRNYVENHSTEKPGHKAKGLPSGLAKKRAQGGALPPGWEKKCVKGEIMPAQVYGHAQPLPPEIIVKLPSPPEGTILISIDSKIARLAKATPEILDVFDVRL
jgi:hypothetical protein